MKFGFYQEDINKMRYLGGKVRIAKQLTAFLKSVRKPGQIYVEPFVGGGAIISLIDGPRIGSDLCPYLITFYRQLQDGWLPPEILSEERYKELKQLYKETVCNGEIGFAMYFCSFGGKAWGGYARDPKSGYDFVKGARNSAIRLIQTVKDVKFYSRDYEDLLRTLPLGCLIYCDIPYINTTQYRFSFDHTRFFNIIREFSNRHDIFVSEYQAPEDFECVWQIERKTCMNTITGGKADRTEKLFKFKGKLDEQIVA
jgi:DNA adenine methylase